MNKYNISQGIIRIIILLFILLIIYIIFISNKICNSSNSLVYHIIDSKKEGPTVMIIGGTHGNEPAGYLAVKKLLEDVNNKKIEITRGKLILVPEVNYCALRLGIRYIPFVGDINRKYPVNINKKISSQINNKIVELAKSADFILDFHEGWGFHKLDNNSIGSTITPNDNKNSQIIAQIFLEKINKTINNDNKKFSILTSDEDLLKLDGYSRDKEIKGTLRYYLNLINKNYVLIETTGQSDIQKLDVRLYQARIFIDELLKYYKLI